MNWELIIGNYGYFALLVGTFLEGETEGSLQDRPADLVDDP
jgi:hypothetical protein